MEEIKNNQYLSDSVLFLIWRLFVADGLIRDHLFMGIRPAGWDNKETIERLFSLESQFGIKFQNPKFEHECFKDGHEDDYKKIVGLTEREAIEKPWEKTEVAFLAESMEECFLIREALLNDDEQLDIEDVRTLLLDVMPKDVEDSLLEGIWFEIVVGEEAKNKLANFLDEYLNNFILDNLSGIRLQNFFTFERHKDLSLGKLKELKLNYGNRFLISGKLSDSNEFLHTHFLLALEKLDYVEINWLRVVVFTNEYGYVLGYEAYVTLRPDFDRLIKGQNTLEQETANQRVAPQQLEITAMPEIVVRNAEDNVITKGKKRINLPKFKPTDWSKITIRFLDERNVVVNADKKEQVVSDYEALGFIDEKRDKPNLAWIFFRGIAKNNGETEQLPTPIPDHIKQQKRQLSDRLKTIFKNDTDPFYDPTETRTYKIKINLIPPQPENEEKDELGVRRYLKETMTEEYEDPEEPYDEYDR